MKSEFFLEAINYVDEKYIEEAREETMKKKFNYKPIIAIAACAAFAIAAVPVAKHFASTSIGGTGDTTVTTQAPPNAEISFNVLYAGGADGGLLGTETEIETEINAIGTNFINKEKVGTTKTIVVDGVEYTGTYTGSTRRDYYRDDTDNYFVQVGEKKVNFSINTETGACRDLTIHGERTSGGKITRDEAYAKAIAHLKTYVPDIENYELVNENNGGTVYDFIWQRKVNGIKTTDAASVTMTKTGEIFAHVLQSAGSFENADIPSIDQQKMEKALSDKINSMYTKYNGITYNAENIMLIRLANGKYAFEYRINIEMRNETNELKKDHGQFIIEVN